MQTTTPLLDGLDPGTYRPHAVHTTDRIWSETNCYVDLWIEVLHASGVDPVPAASFVLGAGFDGRQWDFVKYQPEDLRRLHGIEVNEMNVWKPFAEHLIENIEDGVASTVEVDAFHLPDTAGVSYGLQHTKTTVVPTRIDRAAREMDYFHNAGLFRLSGDDFDRVLGLEVPDGAVALPPYLERIALEGGVLRVDPTEDDRDLDVARTHLRRAGTDNPVAGLAQRVVDDVEWIRESGPDAFHLWSFGTLRQCGATAELAADVAAYLEGRGVQGAGAAAEPFREVATGAKSVQFRMARAARGRAVDPREPLDAMAVKWQQAVDVLRAAL
ncbi:DUF1839 family protein [Rhodococcoides kroppenstedtii]|uniref:DUF1839 family protein n=1 Tax=Rhodococcoides kroppenstedtii TaxID=293050 RepID=UPI00362FAE7D